MSKYNVRDSNNNELVFNKIDLEDGSSIPANIRVDMGVLSFFSPNSGIQIFYKTGFEKAGTVQKIININSIPQQEDFISIVSDNSNDDEAGTGASEVKITGLAEDGALQSEIIMMKGLTAVQTANKYLRVNSIEVLKAVDNQIISGGNQGKITVTHQGTMITEIEKGINIDQMLYYAVPLGYKAFIQTIALTVGKNKSTKFDLYLRKNIINDKSVYKLFTTIQLFESTIIKDVNILFNELDEFFITATTLATGQIEVTATMKIVLIPNFV